jgi:hypothetical protein
LQSYLPGTNENKTEKKNSKSSSLESVESVIIQGTDEKLNNVGKILLEYQPKLKTYAPLGENDPALFFMSNKFLTSFLLGSLITIFVNCSF